jgi:hypothetical protein
MWFGGAGLVTAGVDGRYTNNFICGYITAVSSTGANFYDSDKLDTCGISSTYAFNQGACVGSLCENQFVQTDFSGTYTDSVLINDTTNTTSIFKCVGCIFSSPIIVSAARATLISVSEIGSTTLTNNATGPMILSGNYAFSATTANGTGSRVCATGSNSNITC